MDCEALLPVVDQLGQRYLASVRVLPVCNHLSDGLVDLLERHTHCIERFLLGSLTGLHINDS